MEENLFNTDTLDFLNHTDRPLLYVTLAVFEKHDLCESVKLDILILTNFLNAIDKVFIFYPHSKILHL